MGKLGLKRDAKGRLVKGTPPGPGRPKGDISITTLIKQRLELLGPDQKRTIAEHFVDNIIQDALDGKNYMDKTVWAYIDGTPTDKKEIEHKMPQSLIDFLKDETTATTTGEVSE